MKASISTLSTLLSPTTFAIEHSLRQRHSNNNQHDTNRQLQGECEGSNPSLCGCSSVLQADYRGNINKTVEGVVCQAWDSQEPHIHSRTAENYPNKGLEGEGNNYCRNPDNESNGAWCYTTGSKRWDYCNVPTCQPPTTTTEATTTTTFETTTEATTVTTEQTTSQATTSIQTTSTTSSNSSPTTCSTPELTNLLELTSDLRTVYQSVNLPTIDGSTSSSSLPWEEGETCTTPLSKKKVLLVGIDGLRADVVGMTPLPNIRRLQSMGTYSFWADVQSSASAMSGPGWASMFTGVEPTKHLVSGNGDLGDRAYPTVFKTVKETFGLSIAASVSWHPLVNELIETDGTALDITFEAGSDCEMSAKAEDWIRSEEYDFVFVDFDGPDSAGHSTGFDGYAETYQKRVISVDKLIGNLLDAVLETSSGEEWLIVLTSDHGGEGTSHSAYDKYNRKIPFIVASNSPRVDVGFMPIDDPGSQMDVLPTIMHFLCGSSAVPEGLDGQVFGFKDYTRTPPATADTSTCGTVPLQADYRGTINVTANGVACQAWDTQEPHSHSLTPCNYPDAGLESNYCRNPDGEPNGVWCYTNDPNKRWDYCNVPSC